MVLTRDTVKQMGINLERTPTFYKAYAITKAKQERVSKRYVKRAAKPGPRGRIFIDISSAQNKVLDGKQH